MLGTSGYLSCNARVGSVVMVFTHILVGVLVGALFSIAIPEFGLLPVYAGLLGGAFPDLDMLMTHRRTLHYPVWFSVTSTLATLVLYFFTDSLVVFVAAFTLAAAIHCLMDTLGGGKEMRPWREVDDRAVYNHVAGDWIKPRRLVYDGSLKDLLLSGVSGGLAYYILRPRFRVFIVTVMLLAIVYAAIRRWITRRISEEFTTFSAFIQDRLSMIWSRIS